MATGVYGSSNLDLRPWTNGHYYQSNQYYGNSGYYGNPSIFGNEDDGKLQLGQKASSMVKGVGKMLVNTVKGILTDPKKLLLTAGCMALSVVFPPAGVVLAGIGIVKGASSVIKGYEAASQATTDAEAEAAYENIGGGAFTVAASVVGAKAGLKAMKNTTGSAMNELSTNANATLGDKASAFWKDFKTCGRGGTTPGTGYKAAVIQDSIKAGIDAKKSGGTWSESFRAGVDKAAESNKFIKDVTTAYDKSDKTKVETDGKVTDVSKTSRAYKALKDTINKTSKEKSLARAAAADAKNGTDTSVKAAKAKVKNAEDSLADFKAKDYKLNDEGKYVSADGKTTLSVEDYNKSFEGLNKNVTDATTACSDAQRALRAAKSATKDLKNYKNSLDELNKKLSEATDEATRKSIQGEISELKVNLNKKIASAKTNTYSNKISRTKYNTLTDRTSIFSEVRHNASDAISSSGYTTKGLLETTLPALSEEANSNYYYA